MYLSYKNLIHTDYIRKYSRNTNYLKLFSDLLDEYLKWVPESAHNEVSLYWPPM